MRGVIAITVLLLLLASRALGAEAEPRDQVTKDEATINADYRLSARDLVDVEMFGQPDIKTAQRLTANGEIRLALIGRVTLEGLTVREAEQKVETLFREGGFFINPEVTISVEQYSGQYVAVLGQVRSPDRIPLPPEANSIGILEAITRTGGFTRIARTDAVQVTRANRDGTEERLVVNVQELLNSRRTGAGREFQLLGGDVVFVPERAF